MEEATVNAMLKQTEDASVICLVSECLESRPKQNVDIFVICTE